MIIIGVSKLAGELNVSRKTIYRYCDQGMPFNQKNNNKRVFNLSAVHGWLMGK